MSQLQPSSAIKKKAIERLRLSLEHSQAVNDQKSMLEGAACATSQRSGGNSTDSNTRQQTPQSMTFYGNKKSIVGRVSGASQSPSPTTVPPNNDYGSAVATSNNLLRGGARLPKLGD